MEEVAAAQGLEVADLAVTIQDHAGLGMAGQVFQEKLAAMPTPAPALAGTMRRYEMRAHVRGRKWLWSVDEEVQAAEWLNSPG